MEQSSAVSLDKRAKPPKIGFLEEVQHTQRALRQQELGLWGESPGGFVQELEGMLL